MSRDANMYLWQLAFPMLTYSKIPKSLEILLWRCIVQTSPTDTKAYIRCFHSQQPAQVESSLGRIDHWPGFCLERLPALGHDIGQREATLLGDFLKAHAEDRTLMLLVILLRAIQLENV